MENDFDPTIPPKLEGPFTLEMAEKWLFWLEGLTTQERDASFAMHFVLANLLGRLTRKGIIDGAQFLASLRIQAERISRTNHRVATEAFLDELATVLPEPESEKQLGAPRH